MSTPGIKLIADSLPPTRSTKQEMTKYMQEQQMPWVALAFDSDTADKLRTDYK